MSGIEGSIPTPLYNETFNVSQYNFWNGTRIEYVFDFKNQRKVIHPLRSLLIIELKAIGSNKIEYGVSNGSLKTLNITKIDKGEKRSLEYPKGWAANVGSAGNAFSACDRKGNLICGTIVFHLNRVLCTEDQVKECDLRDFSSANMNRKITFVYTFEQQTEGENEENPVRCQSEAYQSEVQQQLPAEFWQQQLQMQIQYDALKEDNKVRHEKMSEDDRPETLRSGGGDSHDISSPPSPPLPSLREEPGRQEEEAVPRSNSSCESIISETDHPDGLDLERYQAVQPCTVGLPHSCEDYWSTRTDEEFRQLLKWVKRVFQGEDLRPDVKISVENRDGSFHMGFACSLLREMRPWVPLTP